MPVCAPPSSGWRPRCDRADRSIMCGVAGTLVTGSRAGSDLVGIVRAMTDTLAHRGPDGEDTWTDVDNGIVLGHRRLAIVDLGPTGSQPMTSSSGRWVITYNGEIYNHPQLRRQLSDLGTAFGGRATPRRCSHASTTGASTRPCCASTECSRSQRGIASSTGSCWCATGSARSRCTGPPTGLASRSAASSLHSRRCPGSIAASTMTRHGPCCGTGSCAHRRRSTPQPRSSNRPSCWRRASSAVASRPRPARGGRSAR